MTKKINIEIFVEDTDTKKIFNITKQVNTYLKKDDVIKIWRLNNKQLEMYLYRNKDIKTIKYEWKKLIQITILDYVFKNLSKNLYN